MSTLVGRDLRRKTFMDFGLGSGGIFVIGIYNFPEGRRGTPTWSRLKRWSCSVPRWQRLTWESACLAWKLARNVVVGRNLLRMIRECAVLRGVTWRRDVTDWLGGYPYETATRGEILQFMRWKFNFVLVKQDISCDLGVSEFVFESSSNPSQCAVPVRSTQ